MSNVEFESDNMGFNKRGPSKSSGGKGFVFSGQGGQNKRGMTGWLISHGIVRSENTGQIILIAFIAINFIASFLIIKYFGAF